MGRYRFRGKVEPLTDMPPIVAKLDGPELGPRPAPGRVMAATFAVIERVELVPWFHVEPEVIRNLIEPAGDGLAGKQ
jgi:hypothetical protein